VEESEWCSVDFETYFKNHADIARAQAAGMRVKVSLKSAPTFGDVVQTQPGLAAPPEMIDLYSNRLMETRTVLNLDDDALKDEIERVALQDGSNLRKMITAALCAPAKDGVLLREMHGPHIEEMYKVIKRAHDADPASVEALRLFCFKFLSDLMSMYNIFISTSLAELGQANKPPSTFRAFIHLYEDQAREYTHGIASQKFVVVYRSLEAEPHAPVPDVAVRHFFFAMEKQLTNDFWASRKELFQGDVLLHGIVQRYIFSF